MNAFEADLQATQEYFESPRFAGIRRVYSPRQVVEQRGLIAQDYTVAREAAGAFHTRLRELFSARKSITTFGPYSPGQAVTIDYVRDGKKLSGKTELTELPAGQAAVTPAQPQTWQGLKVEDLTQSDRQQLGVTEGAVVRSVESGSAGDNAGFQANDVITKITVRAKGISEKISGTSDFNRVTGSLGDYTKAIAVQIRRNKGTQIITLTPKK